MDAERGEAEPGLPCAQHARLETCFGNARTGVWGRIDRRTVNAGVVVTETVGSTSLGNAGVSVKVNFGVFPYSDSCE